MLDPFQLETEYSEMRELFEDIIQSKIESLGDDNARQQMMDELFAAIIWTAKDELYKEIKKDLLKILQEK